MFGRIVSVALIVVVIACPMLCGKGRCHAGGCCADDRCGWDDALTKACELHGTVDCRCEDAPRQRGGDPPRNCPDKRICQGVCGGAVLDKPVELEVIEFSCMLWLDGDYLVVSRLNPVRDNAGVHRLCVPGQNYGRYTRTLHASFLC